MDDDKWIDAKQRKPTAEDTDAYNCVLAYHKYNGAMVTGWFQFEMNSLFTHWLHLPPPPLCYRDQHGDGHKK